MAKGRRKRDNPDGVALSEWIFFGVLLIVPMIYAVLWIFVIRTCASFLHPAGPRYCSLKEAASWLVDAGGWWKLLIMLGIIGLFTFMGRDDQEGREQASRDSEKTDSDD